MERNLWWLLVCLMPASMPLTAQEMPAETVPRSDVDSSASLLDIYLTLEPRSKPAELAILPLIQEPRRFNGTDRIAAAAVYPERVSRGQQNSLSENSFSNNIDQPNPSGRPIVNHSSERMEAGKTWAAGSPQTTLVDIGRPGVELSEQPVLHSGLDRDPLAIFLTAYDALVQDAESGPPDKTVEETGPTPSQEALFDNWDVEQEEPVVPDQSLTAAEKRQSLPDQKKQSDVVAETSRPAELDGSIEALPDLGNVELVIETGSTGPGQPISVTGGLPVQPFPMEPLIQAKVSVDPSTEPTAQPIIVTRELPTIYFPIEPLIETKVFVDPTAHSELDQGAVGQVRKSQESLVSNDYQYLASAEQIELPSPGAADWDVQVLPETGSVASCDQPVCDQPIGIGGPLKGKRNSRKTFFDVELQLDWQPRGGCKSEACCYDLRCPEVYYSVFGGPTSVTDLVDTTVLNNVDSQATYQLGDAFSFGVAVGQIRGLHLRTELEFAFRRNKFETFGLTQPGQSLSLPLGGEANSFAGMANAYWEFVEFPLRDVKPYVGGGLGFSLFDSDITFLGEHILADRFETDSAFAYQAMAGVNWCTGPNMSLFLEYRYFGTDSIRYKIEDLVNQFEYRTGNIFVGVRFKF